MTFEWGLSLLLLYSMYYTLSALTCFLCLGRSSCSPIPSGSESIPFEGLVKLDSYLEKLERCMLVSPAHLQDMKCLRLLLRQCCSIVASLAEPLIGSPSCPLKRPPPPPPRSPPPPGATPQRARPCGAPAQLRPCPRPGRPRRRPGGAGRVANKGVGGGVGGEE